MEIICVWDVAEGVVTGGATSKQVERRVSRRLAAPCAEQEQTLAILRDVVVSRVQDLPWEPDGVPGALKLGRQFVEEAPVLADGEAADVLEHKCSRFEFDDQAQEVPHQLVARVVERALPDHGEALAGRAADDNVDWRLYGLADPRTVDCGGITAENRALREVVGVCGGMDRIEFDRRYDVETGLFEAKAESTYASENVNRCRARQSCL